MLDREQLGFLQTGVSISLAACNPAGLASISRGLGCKVSGDGQRVSVFIRHSQSLELLENVRASGRVANVFSLPSSHRTLQLKGSDARVEAFDQHDLGRIETHVVDFIGEVGPLGIPAEVVRAMLAFPADDLVTVTYTPCAAFSQTPGPKAGEPIGAAP